VEKRISTELVASIHWLLIWEKLPLSSLDAGFGELVVFGSVFFGFDHVATIDQGCEVFR